MSLVLAITLIIFLLLSVPLAISIAFSGILAILYAGDLPTFVGVQRLFTGLDSFPLMAIPFFLLAGKIMEKGGISRRLIDLAASVVGSTTGGLAMIAILACMFFAAISGSAPATVVAIGSIMVPAMLRAGYDKGFTIALMAVAGTIGVMIPPSIPFILYGIAASTSIGDLFIAGILPGILVGVSLMVYSYFIAKARGYKGGEPTSLKRFLTSLKSSIWGILMPVIILGGIYSGAFTPTESGAIACVYGLIISYFVYRDAKLSDLKPIFVESGATSAMVLLIVGAANIMSWILSTEQIPMLISGVISDFASSSVILMLVINLLLLFVGTFLELGAAIIILVPILLPLLGQFDINLVHFGVMMVVNLAIGLLTPPLGVNLFVAKSLSDLSFNHVVRAVIPFLAVVILNLFMIAYIPQISLLLLGD
ncbi:TRAP transporter large permease [Alkalihalobacillus oceani]|uniref:TRAP transporter large permease n=1 Tax=Halalkalibacter oceani TaxID=1653776 RepID=A0A9X2IS42_9BACI|nr:TRAP transporter large permease [Halalkalibacter oceani]MCM3716168.1 TRAP transporter large permease [Halalkalibacter oceani]